MAAEKTLWNLETQEFHGGQSWRTCKDFHADFSVTTNAFGPPPSAVRAAREQLEHIQHYPAADAGEVKAALAKFCDIPQSQMLVGNGASEFIDLVMKALPPGPFRPGPFIATYQEYHRAARAAGRSICPSNEPVDADGNAPTVTVYIRPNSPTGQLAPLEELEKLLDDSPSLTVLVDESFLPFAGPSWRELSALNLIENYPKRLIVLQSWTKLWSCTGLRLGTVSASSEWIKIFSKLQTPWSCNILAQAFGAQAARDMAYLEKTWRYLREWQVPTVASIKELGWSVNTDILEWVPWVFVKCPSVEVAIAAVQVAHSAGCPVRHGASYGLPQYIRVAVRQPEYQQLLFGAWRERFGVLQTS